ncbi:MAG: hypothetical protein JNL41_01225 [Phenylobacterium sp.]|uniref:hypothetical protein n=1 Tax=Phenylobacterium sp. TaxID=1871053 RepID=UPI001A397494|nr:hypothetical protein [Phenylobacterium sp.]MBL8552869.1 hypothetical protein [Phenylobacterium sp.]
MRRFLVLFALLGLLYSPAAAVAAQQTCAEAMGDMPGMVMAASADDHSGAAADPCCDHGAKTTNDKACAQACAVMCGVVAALPETVVYVPPVVQTPLEATPIAALKPHPPPRAERPPRLIA